MSNAKRTFQITLPDFQWRSLCTFPVLLSGFLFFTSCVGLYWWQAVRPYIWIEQAQLVSPSFPIAAKGAGKVAALLVEEGDSFSQGQSLFTLEDSRRDLRQVEDKLKMAQERLEQETKRLEETLEKYVQEQEVNFLLEVQDSQQMMNQLEQEISQIQGERLTLQNKGNQSSAAPFDGMVLNALKRAGEDASLGETVLLVSKTEAHWVEAEIPEQILSKIQVGSSALLEFIAFPGKRWPAKISWISPIVKEGKLKVRLTADQLPHQSGLSAKVRLKVY
ncbi:MAG: efflux RND transporter periplasmic adaptor subunit [Verrucomicrobiota bacterium]|nr:efflux RND transporter periplasmic adaptor subunit [Verrucomicrobiota bacterium]